MIGGEAGSTRSVLLPVAQVPAIRLLTLVLLLSAAALWEAKKTSAFSSDEIWCHLRTGTWILQNRAIPSTGLFSQLSGSHWIDFSWLYDAFCGALYKLFGLRAIPLLLMMFKVAVAAVTFLLAGGRRNFWWAVSLSAFAQFAITYLQPLPNMFSICFFGLALHWILKARCRKRLAPLVWLPLLFWLWANLDAQVVLGLLLLGLFVLVEIIERGITPSVDSGFQRIPLFHLAAIAAGCVIATLITPYSIHLLSAAWQSEYSPTLFKNFAFMAAMSFRQPAHFVLALLLFAACLQLGRQRSHDIFKVLFLVFCAALAFRVQRDNWTVVLAAIAVLGGKIGIDSGDVKASRQGSAAREYFYPGAGVAILLTFSFFLLPSSRVLETRIENVFPAKACDYVHANHLRAPLFNDYQWGGYLMWKLPEYPVFVDERLNLYGDEFRGAYFEAVMGKRRMETLPGFSDQQTILLPVNIPMAKALTTIAVLQQQFREVYRDNIAIVLVRR